MMTEVETPRRTEAGRGAEKESDMPVESAPIVGAFDASVKRCHACGSPSPTGLFCRDCLLDGMARRLAIGATV